MYHIKANTISKCRYEEIEKKFAGVQHKAIESCHTSISRTDKEKTLQLEWKTSSENNLLQKQLKHAREKNSNFESEIEKLQDENRKLEKTLHERQKEINQGHVEILRLKLETEKLERKIKELNEKPLADREVRRLTDLNIRLMKKNEKLEANLQGKLSEIAQGGFQIGGLCNFSMNSKILPDRLSGIV